MSIDEVTGLPLLYAKENPLSIIKAYDIWPFA